MFVPVVDRNNKPLMPTKPGRARKWIESARSNRRRKRNGLRVKQHLSGKRGYFVSD